MQHEYLQLLTPKVEADGRINAAWLEGSFGRGNADRYSDLDIHLLLPEHGLADFQADVEVWLSSIRPLALFNLMFDGKMVNALTRDGLRLDLWLHAGESIALEQGKTLVLFETDGRIHLDKTSQPPDPDVVAAALLQQTREFWRCIALLPSVLGRNELIAGFMGLVVEVNLLTEILIAGHGITRDRGVKNLNHFLPDNTRRAIEDALSMEGLSAASLAQAHLGLARMLQQHGPAIAERHQYAYPAELEDAVLEYVERELKLLRVDASVASA